jgi:signal transduction histidine kinase
MRQTTEESLTPDSQAVSLGYYQKLFAGLQAGRLPQGFRGELEYKCKDGSTRWTETIALPVFGPDGAVVEMLGVSRDLDERKRGEAALSAQRDEIEALNRSLEVRVDQAVAEIRTKDQLLIAQNRHAAMGQMIGNIAHQWRQPLNALTLVLANLEDAARFGDLDAATLTEAVDDSNQLIQKMSATIDDFRNFFRPEKKRVVFSAISQVRGTLALLEASFRNTGITVEVDAPSDVSLFGLPNEYSQVLMNLFTNARQAIEGAKVANGRMTVRLRERDGFGAVTVSDDGGGIPEALLLRLGEPYFTTKDGGTGLGIYMSRQIVELSMGGRLEVRNVDGGAEFTVLSPLAGSVSVVSTSRRQ